MTRLKTLAKIFKTHNPRFDITPLNKRGAMKITLTNHSKVRKKGTNH